MILIIEDDPAVLETAKEVLNHQRRVFFASDSKRAFELAKDLGFSVVLVDLDMRREDGLVLIRQIHDRFPGLPIIAISAMPQKIVVELAAEFGAAEILQKPVTPEWKLVVERVRAMAHRRTEGAVG